MEGSFQILEFDDYFMIKFLGKSPIEKVIEACRGLYGRTDYVSKNEIWDFSSTKPKGINYNALKRLVSYFQKIYKEEWGSNKTAVVVDSDLLYGLAKIFQAVSSQLPHTVSVFKSIEGAKEWIEIQDL